MFSLGQLSVCVCVCEGDEGVHMSEARCFFLSLLTPAKEGAEKSV